MAPRHTTRRSPGLTRPRNARTRPARRRRASSGQQRARRRRAVAAIVAGAVAFAVQHSVDAATAQRRSWTADTPVLVLRRAVRAGERIGAGDVVRSERPRELSPDDAVASLPADPTAAADLSQGTVLSSGLVERRSRSATARALAPGSVAVAVRTGDLPRLAERGDVVDVASPSWERPVASGATVIAVDGDAVTLAVEDHDASSVAAASLTGPVALVVRG